MITIPDFINTFPEFKNENTFPSTRVQFWLGIAESMVNQRRWGVLYNQGVFLLLAHYLVLDARHRQAIEAGSLPGIPEGLDTAQDVDDVSYNADVKSITLANAGIFNSTEYGIQFYQLAKWRGMGPLSALTPVYIPVYY